MDAIFKTPEDLNYVIWKFLDRPVLLINGKTNEVISGNKAAFDFFKMEENLKGISWPNVLDLLNLPEGTNLSLYNLLPSKTNQKRTVYWSSFEYTDTESAVDRRLVFQFIKPKKSENDPSADDIRAVVIIDQTSIYQANKERSDFVSLASHQLRTPLSGIKWSLDILLKHKDSLDEKQQHLLENAKKSADRMNELIIALLQVSRVETGTLEIEPSKVEINELLDDTIDSLKEQADKHGNTINKEVNIGQEKIIIDGSLVKYLFNNLISNAIKYSNENSEIDILMKQVDKMLVVQIRNIGIGIPKENQKNIFNKFYRAPNALKHTPDGTGLGLHLCKIIAKRCGGDIWFESQEAEGGNKTTFWFNVPIKNE